MSRDTSSYSLRTSIFTTCGGTWDQESNSYKQADISAIAQCCLDQCSEPVQFCLEYCKNNSQPGGLYDTPDKIRTCEDTCTTYENLCNNICKLSSPQFTDQSTYLNCVEWNGCMNQNGKPDQECLQANKDTIHKCCLHNCVPTQDIDCNKYCDFSYKLASMKPVQAKNMILSKSGSIQSSKTTHSMIIGISTGLIGLMILYVLFVCKNRKNGTRVHGRV